MCLRSVWRWSREVRGEVGTVVVEPCRGSGRRTALARGKVPDDRIGAAYGDDLPRIISEPQPKLQPVPGFASVAPVGGTSRQAASCCGRGSSARSRSKASQFAIRPGHPRFEASNSAETRKDKWPQPTRPSTIASRASAALRHEHDPLVTAAVKDGPASAGPYPFRAASRLAAPRPARISHLFQFPDGARCSCRTQKLQSFWRLFDSSASGPKRTTPSAPRQRCEIASFHFGADLLGTTLSSGDCPSPEHIRSVPEAIAHLQHQAVHSSPRELALAFHRRPPRLFQLLRAAHRCAEVGKSASRRSAS